MRGFYIVNIRLSFFEDDNRSNSQVTVEWAHDAASAAHVLKLCGDVDLPPIAMLESYGLDSQRAPLKTVRQFRFESREDALEVYDKFETELREQKHSKEKVVIVHGA